MLLDFRRSDALFLLQRFLFQLLANRSPGQSERGRKTNHITLPRFLQVILGYRGCNEVFEWRHKELGLIQFECSSLLLGIRLSGFFLPPPCTHGCLYSTLVLSYTWNDACPPVDTYESSSSFKFSNLSARVGWLMAAKVLSWVASFASPGR